MGSTDDTEYLRRCIRDLVTLSSLHALWIKRPPRETAQNLCQVILSTLRLDPVLVWIQPTPVDEPIVVSASAEWKERNWVPHARKLLQGWQATPRFSTTFPFKLNGQDRQLAIVPIGYNGSCGAIAVSSERETFPDEIDRLFLGVCAHQTAIAIQNYRLLEAERETCFLQDKIVQREQEARREAENREELFRLYTEGVKDSALVLLDAKGNVIDWNAGAKRLYGFRSSDICGQPISRCSGPTSSREWKAKLKTAEANGAVTEELPQRRRDGSEFIAQVVVTSLKCEGELRGFAHVTRDITHRRSAEMALRRSEEGFRAIFQQSPVGMALVGPDLKIKRSNSAFRRMVRYSEQELSDLHLGDITYSDDVELDAVETERLYRGDIPAFQVEKRLCTRNLEIIWAKLTISLIRDEARRICYKVVVVENITEQKRAEDKIHFQASLLDQVCNAVIATDLSANITSWNRHAEKLYQWKAREVLGKHALDLLLVEGLNGEVQRIRDHIEKEGCWEGEFPMRRKDGSVFQAYVIEAPIRRNNGRATGYVGVVIDITERKRAEEELRRSQEQMRALTAHLHWVREKERAHIAREIHDELGQALTGLKIDLSWLDHRVADGSNTSSPARLREKIASMSSLIDATIQQVRKISTELRPRILDELGLVAAIEWQAREFQTRTGIVCKFQTNADHIALDDDRATAIFRIFQETLTNVLRHAKGSSVEITLKKSEKGLTLEVTDNGRGIPKRKIFDSQSLGLLGMRERALLSQGHLTITGVRGHGTTVSLWIPTSETKKTSGAERRETVLRHAQ